MVRQNARPGSRPPPRRAANAANAKKTELNQEDFLTLMITQLKNQDPFKPMDPAQYVGQLAQFSSVSGLAEMNKHDRRADRARLRGNQVLDGAALIGRTVIAAGQPDLSDPCPPKARRVGPQGAIDVPAGASSVQLVVQGFEPVRWSRRRRSTPRAGLRRLHLGRHHRRRRAARRPAPTRSKSSPRSATRTFL